MTTSTDRRYGVAEGLAVKAPCACATTGSITLAGLQTIDGVALAESDRVLVKEQGTASENGVYVASSGNWSRAADFDGARDVAKGTRVFVHSGAVNGNTEFAVTSANPILPGTSSIAFASLATLEGHAPPAAQYLVAQAHADLSAERVVTDTATVTWDHATAGQAKANVANASLTGRGAVELATNAEAVAGTDTERAVTPAALAAALLVFKSVMRNYIDGFVIANGSDATNDIDFGAGACLDSDNDTFITGAAMAGKRLDEDWAPGENAGLRYSGAAIANTTYHLWVVTKADGTQDYYADPSAVPATVLAHLQAETGGADYVVARLVASILRESGAIVGIVQYPGGLFLRKSGINSVSDSASHNASRATGTLHVPTGIAGLLAICEVGTNDNTTSFNGTLVTALTQNDDAPTVAGTRGLTVSGSNSGSNIWKGGVVVPVNTSGQVGYRGSHSNVDTQIVTVGWIHPRGRDS
jgi:hypothetical protein